MPKMADDIKKKIYRSLFGLIVISILPYIHIGIVHMKIWVPKKKPVNRTHCNCGCFDTIFKGSYEQPGKVGYKHIYFNSTSQTYLIWLATLVSVICLYELLKSLWNLYQEGKLRWMMVFLIFLDIYPHYYTWWSIFNYLNDDFYVQFRHQMFFSVTELISTVIIFSLCSTDSDVLTWKILAIVCISVIHILIGGVDQFFVQLIFGDGAAFQKSRNFGFLIPDLLHILIPIALHRIDSKDRDRNIQWSSMYSKKELSYFSLCVMSGFVLGKIILS